MEISNELKNKMLAELEKYKPTILDRINRITVSPGTAYLSFQIILNGATHAIRFNVKKKQFDRLDIWVVKNGLVTSENIVGQWVSIDLPAEFWEK